MNVFINAAMGHVRKIVVDDVHHIANVETTTRHSSGDEDGALASAESTTANRQWTLGRCKSTLLTVHLRVHAEYGQNEWK